MKGMMTEDSRILLQASSDSGLGPALTLVDIGLDLQITICTLLHPSDILALRETCKTLQIPTRQRIVWVAALHRVCLDNSLFLPSFPILEMSNEELEHAAMAPRRWIELCSAAFEKQHLDDSGATLRPRTTRIIENSVVAAEHCKIFIVPGGRYVMNSSSRKISIWDFGYTSSADCKLIASVEIGPEETALVGNYHSESFCMVQATPDGMGLIIFATHVNNSCSVYEIYPQSETPRLTRIAHLDCDPDREFEALLLPDRVLWYYSNRDSIIFIVWDYRMNYSTSFSADTDSISKDNYYFKVIATKTAIIVPCVEKLLVWAIPPLSPQPPDFFDHNPTHIPFFGITYPDGIVSCHDEFVPSQTMSYWYGGSSQPLYFDILCRDSKLRRFEIIVTPDLFDTSLRIIHTEEFVSSDFDDMTFDRYSICEDTLVACWEYFPGEFELYTWSRFTTAISRGGPAAKVSLPSTARGYGFTLCPASGRYVHIDYNIRGIVVVDLL